METLREMHERLLSSTLGGKKIDFEKEDAYQLDCLLHPKKYPPVVQTGPCDCPGEDFPCVKSCIFGALKKNEDGQITIDKDTCTGCGECLASCEKLEASKESLALLYTLKEQKEQPIYVLIAPAFIGQFQSGVTPGKLRSAFKELGFTGMVEVALFADILTLKESFEFNQSIQTEADFMLTSCCCPVWIAMIRKIFHHLMPHVPAAVSPMVACARAVKVLHPGAGTVFIGPCLAKKSEAREKDIEDAVDFVLTFQETKELFACAGIDPEKMQDDPRDHSSKAGRIYARTGGVSLAIEASLARINPDRPIAVRSCQANGVKECRALLNDLMAGNIPGNFIEGMGCLGGCVGGPKIMIPMEEGRANVEEYANSAVYETPIDNPYVIELLELLGYHSPEELLTKSHIFTREFD